MAQSPPEPFRFPTADDHDTRSRVEDYLEQQPTESALDHGVEESFPARFPAIRGFAMAASAAHRSHGRSRRECAVHGGLDAGRSTPDRQCFCADQCDQSLAMGSRVPRCGSRESSSHRCGLRDAPPCCHLLGNSVCMVVRQPSEGAVSSCCTGGRHGSGRGLLRGRLHRHAGTAQTRLRAPAVEACHGCHVWRICHRARSRLPAGQPALRFETASEMPRDRRARAGSVRPIHDAGLLPLRPN
jgi:hypothetical protein